MLAASPIGSSVGPYKSVLWPRDLKGPPPGSKGSPCVGKGEDGPAHLLQDRQGHVSVSTLKDQICFPLKENSGFKTICQVQAILMTGQDRIVSVRIGKGKIRCYDRIG